MRTSYQIRIRTIIGTFSFGTISYGKINAIKVGSKDDTVSDEGTTLGDILISNFGDKSYIIDHK
jgi:hypothetical protein